MAVQALRSHHLGPQTWDPVAQGILRRLANPGAAEICRTFGLLDAALCGTSLTAFSLGVSSRRPIPSKGNPLDRWGRGWYGSRACPLVGGPANHTYRAPYCSEISSHGLAHQPRWFTRGWPCFTGHILGATCGNWGTSGDQSCKALKSRT